jgi:uncharacterized membrane protein YedE/YeeE
LSSGARPRLDDLRAGATIGALAALLFLVSGQPWGITTGLTLMGAKAIRFTGFDLVAFDYWASDDARAVLAGPLLASHSALADLGLLLGAFIMSGLRGGLRHQTPLGWRGAAGAAIGGVLMGVGARLSFGCNIGAFVGGASSGSLHGFVWIAAVLPGCWVGMQMRPVFGLPR